ncbi:MAG: hypothetical protein CMJ18_21740 [Phycisphaeraceae bacterium]|nr:hypothetical protein [Phycisphaeraceae bacterium]
MQTCDFRNSYFFFEVDHDRAPTVTAKQPIKHNQVRIPLECLCEVTAPDGTVTQFMLCASCKTERVAVERDIFNLPNADFCVVASDRDFMIVKRWQQCDMSVERESSEMAVHIDRQVGNASDAWTSYRTDRSMVEGRPLESDAEIVKAMHANTAIVSRTEFDLEDGHRVLLEYPVKTLNVSDRAGNYQIDTGPVLYPDLSIDHESFIGNLRLAYVAHHQPDWAEFIVNVPTRIDGGALVHHFSDRVRVDAKNTMIALD